MECISNCPGIPSRMLLLANSMITLSEVKIKIFRIYDSNEHGRRYQSRINSALVSHWIKIFEKITQAQAYFGLS